MTGSGSETWGHRLWTSRLRVSGKMSIGTVGTGSMREIWLIHWTYLQLVLGRMSIGIQMIGIMREGLEENLR